MMDAFLGRNYAPRSFEKIVIVDDQPVDPNLLTALGAAFGERSIRIAGNLEAAVDPAQRLLEHSLVLLEPALRGCFGMEVLSQFRAFRPEVPIAVRSAVMSRAAICAALAAGVLGYFPKTMPPSVVVAGLHCIAAGGTFVPPEALAGNSPAELPSPVANQALTAAQTRVLRLLLTGRSNREIGRELNISEGTVKQILYALYRILGVTSRAGVIAGVARSVFQHDEMPAAEA